MRSKRSLDHPTVDRFCTSHFQARYENGSPADDRWNHGAYRPSVAIVRGASVR
jgi:hypothetical protein